MERKQEIVLLKSTNSKKGNHARELQLSSCTTDMKPILEVTYLALNWSCWGPFDIPKLVFANAVRES